MTLQLPLLGPRCPADAVATVQPAVPGDDSGPYWWAVRAGASGWAATRDEAWARVDALKRGPVARGRGES